nr:HrgA protein [Rheinheimera soli]
MVFKCLKDAAGQQFTARQLAEMIVEKYPEQASHKKANSGSNVQTMLDLIEQFAAEIGSRRPGWQEKNTQLKTTSGRPRKYYWSEHSDEAEVNLSDSLGLPAKPLATEQSALPSDPPAIITEHSLYPLLAKYLKSELDVFSMRIDEKTSSNKGGMGSNEWLHPDLVGLEDLASDWVDVIKSCVAELSERRARLWSFEVKILINRSNVRKSYFQTVSNSSWAHYGYLVAATVEGEDTMRELQMLSATHGIGVIQLDVNEPTESQILIPAKERATLDWEMCNRLAEENKDFTSYLQKIGDFSKLGKVLPTEWLMK